MSKLSAPIGVCLVLTDACNFKCRHCLNYWRQENNRYDTLTRDQIDRLASIFSEAGIFHITISGGEPFVHFDLLEYAIKVFKNSNFTFSCNSNLILATDDRIKRLVDLGLDHILTSLNSYDAQTDDYIASSKGAHNKIIKGIRTAIGNGMRLSANMIVTKGNKDHVYKTGLLAHELGCTKFFGTRMVPNILSNSISDSDYQMKREECLFSLDELLRVKKDTGMMIGTLVSYPLCMLGDLEKYRDFVGRGCASQAGNRINVNPNGDVQACPHSNINAGNIFTQRFSEIWDNMLSWHDGSLRNQRCVGCRYIDICHTGCRISSSVINKALNGPDPLMVDPHAIYKHYEFESTERVEDSIRSGCRFTVPKRLRFREEKDFYVVNVRWANVLTLDKPQTEILKRYWISGRSFTIDDFGRNNLKTLTNLFFKNAIESEDLRHVKINDMLGCSIDPSVLL